MLLRKSSGYNVHPTRRDQRRAGRKATRTQAYIRLGDSFAARTCTVLDLSDTGVRIALDCSASTIPDTFSLLLSRNAKGRPARVRWRRGTQIGAQFL
jgi:hypothetical protein